MNRERSERGNFLENSVCGIKNHRSAAVRGARAGCAPPGSASAIEKIFVLKTQKQPAYKMFILDYTCSFKNLCVNLKACTWRNTDCLEFTWFHTVLWILHILCSLYCTSISVKTKAKSITFFLVLNTCGNYTLRNSFAFKICAVKVCTVVSIHRSLTSFLTKVYTYIILQTRCWVVSWYPFNTSQIVQLVQYTK